MSFTKVEVINPNKAKKISIKTYFDPEQENMGLENYEMVLHDGVSHTEQLACLENNGIKRYLTGLNEFAPDIKRLPKEQKEAKIKEIRTTVAQLEAELAANMVDIDDKDFWNKIELLRPNNSIFWDAIELSVGNQSTSLDPQDPYDLIKLCAIGAGGFSMVAKSYEEARAMAKPPKFYLDKHEETVTTKNEGKMLRNKAGSELQKMFDKSSAKLLYVTKVIDPGSAQYTKSTPNAVLYEVMDDFINGYSYEKNRTKAAEKFLDTTSSTMEDLKLTALVKDAAYSKVIISKSDGFLYHQSTQSLMGRNATDVMEYLKNPINDSILAAIMEVIELQWNK